MHPVIQKLLHPSFLLITCKRYTELSSKSLDSPLTWTEKPSFFLHHYICTFCRRFHRQLNLLERVGKGIADSEEYLDSNEKLSEECTKKIKDSL